MACNHRLSLKRALLYETVNEIDNPQCELHSGVHPTVINRMDGGDFWSGEGYHQRISHDRLSSRLLRPDSRAMLTEAVETVMLYAVC